MKILKTNSIVSSGNSIGYPITWQVVDTVNEVDGFQDNRKIKVGFFDGDDDGVVDNPELFDIVIEPTLSESTKFVFFETYTSYDTIERFRPYAATNFVVTENESSISLDSATYDDEQLFYFYAADEDVIKKYSSTTNTLTTTTDYRARRGRSSISFNINTMPDRKQGLILVCQTLLMFTYWREHTITFSGSIYRTEAHYLRNQHRISYVLTIRACLIR